jgi:hypothetical protein
MSAAVAGTIGPVLFATVIFALSVLEYDFMLGIGWRPVADPAGAWPSGLALGPYGLAQVANFGLLLTQPSSRGEGWARLATRSSIPLRGRFGDDTNGLCNRSDTEDRTP